MAVRCCRVRWLPSVRRSAAALAALFARAASNSLAKLGFAVTGGRAPGVTMTIGGFVVTPVDGRGGVTGGRGGVTGGRGGMAGGGAHADDAARSTTTRAAGPI